MVQTAQNPYEREKFNTQDEFIQQGQDMTTSLAGSSAPQATPLTSTGASATTDILPPPTEIQKTPTEKYAAPPGGQISYEGYNPSTVQGTYAKYFNPLTSKLGESSTALGTAVSGFNTAAGLPRTFESAGGQEIFSGIEKAPSTHKLSAAIIVSPEEAASLNPETIRKAAGATQPYFQTLNFTYPEYIYSPASQLSGAEYTGPTGLDQAALNSILENIGSFSAFMNPGGVQTDLTSGFGAQELMKMGTSGLTPGELRLSARDLLQNPEYRNYAAETQKNLVNLYKDFLRTQGEATAIGEARTAQEKAIADEARNRIAGLTSKSEAEKLAAQQALEAFLAGHTQYGTTTEEVSPFEGGIVPGGGGGFVPGIPAPPGNPTVPTFPPYDDNTRRRATFKKK